MADMSVYVASQPFGGVWLDVKYEYFKGERPSIDCPGDPEEFFIYSVIQDGVEIYDLLSDKSIDAIKCKVMEELP